MSDEKAPKGHVKKHVPDTPGRMVQYRLVFPDTYQFVFWWPWGEPGRPCPVERSELVRLSSASEWVPKPKKTRTKKHWV